MQNARSRGCLLATDRPLIVEGAGGRLVRSVLVLPHVPRDGWATSSFWFKVAYPATTQTLTGMSEGKGKGERYGCPILSHPAYHTIFLCLILAQTHLRPNPNSTSQFYNYLTLFVNPPQRTKQGAYLLGPTYFWGSGDTRLFGH